MSAIAAYAIRHASFHYADTLSPARHAMPFFTLAELPLPPLMAPLLSRRRRHTPRCFHTLLPMLADSYAKISHASDAFIDAAMIFRRILR
jgi:hypothetical protein